MKIRYQTNAFMVIAFSILMCSCPGREVGLGEECGGTVENVDWCSEGLNCCYDPHESDGSGTCVRTEDLGAVGDACGIAGSLCCADHLSCEFDDDFNGVCQ